MEEFYEVGGIHWVGIYMREGVREGEEGSVEGGGREERHHNLLTIQHLFMFHK